MGPPRPAGDAELLQLRERFFTTGSPAVRAEPGAFDGLGFAAVVPGRGVS